MTANDYAKYIYFSRTLSLYCHYHDNTMPVTSNNSTIILLDSGNVFAASKGQPNYLVWHLTRTRDATRPTPTAGNVTQMSTE